MAVQRELSITLALMVVVGLVVPSYGCLPAAGVKYLVGDSFWFIPPNVDYYTSWSSNHFFKISDSLVFDFETGRYTVMQVTKQEYESCTAYKPLQVFNSGPQTIPLQAKGVFYYICNISNYCTLGQKISIAVHECPYAIPPSTSQSPSHLPSPAAIPLSSPPHISLLPPSPCSPVGSQPPYVQQGESPAPSSSSNNGSREGPSNSAALLDKGIYFGYGVFFAGFPSWCYFMFLGDLGHLLLIRT